jgi:hypothetical protein
MKWSKMKSELLGRLPDSMKKRINYNMASYGNSTDWGRTWMTLDKKEVINFSAPDTWKYYKSCVNIACNAEMNIHNSYKHKSPKNEHRKHEFMEPGEFSRLDFGQSAYEFLTQMSIDESLKSENPIHRMLAVLDSRTGKRSLEKLKTSEEFPLVLKMIELREQCEREAKM